MPEITGAPSVNFDSVLGKYKITIPLSGNTDDIAAIDFELMGVAQTVLTSTADQVEIQIDSVLSGLADISMNLYLGVGIPKGFAELTPIALTP